MKRQDVEKLITEYIKPIFGFALKRCKSLQDAEDLSQEIILKAFQTLLLKDDICNVEKYIWTIAHNMLNNYYRDSFKTVVNIPLDEISESALDPYFDLYDDDTNQFIRKLQSEIAYLSKMQRRIVVAYYFENRKQTDIAYELGIPVGTVKWHLFEAKKELKRGMDIMRQTSELKFNPIRFQSYGINGSVGTKSLEEFFRSILSQNICYCVLNTAKTVNEISDDIGVSPIYVEHEVEFLEKYGFLQSQKDRYISNFIISEPDTELLKMQNDMYKSAADLFANDLYDELISSNILNSRDILCRQTDNSISLTESNRADDNFLLWSLIPYIAACSGEKLIEERISFEEVATIRPDGGHNICYASVMSGNIILPSDYVYMNNWCGPMWIRNGDYILWQIDSEWSDRDNDNRFMYAQKAERVLSLYKQEFENVLSKDEYTWLSESGYVKTNGDYDGNFKSLWQVVILDNKEIKDKLLNLGEKIKIKYKNEFELIKAPYCEAVLKSVPVH